MNQTNREIATNRTHLLVDISAEEKKEAKAIAKKKGMTFQGWTAQLIRNELENNKNQGVVNG